MSCWVVNRADPGDGLDAREDGPRGVWQLGEGDWLVIRGIDDERVPELVAHIVRLGGRVYAVEPRHESLEDRFLRLLGQPN